MCADQSREKDLERESGSGATPPKRSIADEPEFQELLKRVGSLPPDRKQALDELLDDESKMDTASKVRANPPIKSLPEKTGSDLPESDD